jgi:competence protein ComGC
MHLIQFRIRTLMIMVIVVAVILALILVAFPAIFPDIHFHDTYFFLG